MEIINLRKVRKIYPDYLTPMFFIKSSLPHQSTFFKERLSIKWDYMMLLIQFVLTELFILNAF